jgi:hypothetical protein
VASGPLRDPADGAGEREQHREHRGREAERLEGDARVKTTHEVLNELGIKDDLLEVAVQLEKIALEDEYFIENPRSSRPTARSSRRCGRARTAP